MGQRRETHSAPGDTRWIGRIANQNVALPKAMARRYVLCSWNDLILLASFKSKILQRSTDYDRPGNHFFSYYFLLYV